MPITSQFSYTTDLARGVTITPLGQLLFTGDKNGDTFRITVTDAGAAVDLSGASVQAYLMRADHVTVPVTGSVEGNVAVVTLPSSCYAAAGRFVLVVKLSTSDSLHTIFAAEGAVVRSSTDTVADAEGVIPSLTELLAQIAVMEQATASAKTAASAANTAASSANTAAADVKARADAGEFDGRGLVILGYYETADALAAEVASPAAGDAYGVGTGEPYDVYVWDAVNAVWVNNGAIQGPQGKTGPRGLPGTDAKRNLLDNSDFRNPVNQRGKSSYTEPGYTIDRWMLGISEEGALSVAYGDARMSAVSGYVDLQQIPGESVALAGKPMTFAANITNIGILILNFTYGEAASVTSADGSVSLIHNGTDRVIIRVLTSSWIAVQWAALYEGEYTAETLPEYIWKGYAAELAECQRYYQNHYVIFGSDIGSTQRQAIRLSPLMRIAPTVTVGSISGGTTAAVTIKISTTDSINFSSTSWGSTFLAASADL